MSNQAMLNAVSNQSEVINLNVQGYMDAGLNNGNPDSYQSKLNLICGKIEVGEITVPMKSNDEDIYAIPHPEQINAEIYEKERKISETTNKIEENNSKKSGINQSINTIKNWKEEIKQKIEAYIKGELKGYKKFSLLKFIIAFFFLLMVSAFLFLFYSSTLYKALFIDITILIDGLSDNNGDLGISTGLPSPQEMKAALSSNPLVWFGPFVFFGFGYAIHTILDWEVKPIFKFLVLTCVILVTFVLDFLMAYKIHSNTNEALSLMGLEVEQWQTSPIFYIIILMGFVVFIIWSILLHAWIIEWGKRDVLAGFHKLEERYDKQLKEKEKELDELEELNASLKGRNTAARSEIARIKELSQKPRVSDSFLEVCLQEYHNGWSDFLSGKNVFASHLSKCQAIFENKLKNRFPNKY